MAHAPAYPAEAPVDRGQLARPTVQALPVTPGKVAMWLFLATEIMFFTGLIGSYVVLRGGSPATGYSNLFPPATDLTYLKGSKGVMLTEVGSDRHRVVEAIRSATGADEHEVEHWVDAAPHTVMFG